MSHFYLFLFPFIGLFHPDFFFHLSIFVVQPDHSLRPVDLQDRSLVFLCPGFSNLLQQFLEDFSGEVATPPVESQHFSFFGCLKCPFVDLFLLRKGQLLFFIIEVIVIGADRSRRNQRFMIPEDLLIIQVEVIISNLASIPSQCIVEGSIQMIVHAIQLHNIPPDCCHRSQ